MSRQHSLFLALAVVCGGALFLSNSARSQLGVAKNYVNLQATTPGTAQSGHSNVSGTSRAAQFVGGGAGLTGVNADLLDGLNSTDFLTAVPNPLILSGASMPAIVDVSQSSSGPSAKGIFATLTSPSPSASASAIAGLVASSTVNGIGVYGAHQGSGVGVQGEAVDGVGVRGLALGFGTAVSAVATNGIGLTASSNTVAAVYAVSSQFHGIEAVSNATSGTFAGITAISNSADGIGVRGTSTGTGSFATGVLGVGRIRGVEGTASQPNGIGVVGQSSASTQGIGVYGTAGGVAGAGVFGFGTSASGFGVYAANNAGGLALAADGPSRFSGNIQMLSSARLSVGAGASPVFPIDFSDSLGDKISLWGSSPTSHYGFGIQNSLLQIFASNPVDSIAFGDGSSSSFSEWARFASGSHLLFKVDNTDVTSTISGPWDIVLLKDRDSDSNNEWLRVFTNNGLIEQFRIEADDEAAARFDGVVTSNGIDYAEAFKVYDPTLEPGDLVINAGSNWEYIGRSMRPYDNSVIGVISTKPAFLAGLSFDAEEQIDPALTKRRDDARRKGDEQLEKALTMQMRKKAEEAHRPVAFMGRVPVKVVGPVKVGDHLTSSHIPGVAMAMTQPGHSIGIALEASAGGQAKVMGMIQPRFYAGPVAQGGLASVPEIKEMAARVAKLETESKSLRAENQQLRARSQALQEDNTDLKARIERLESMVLKR